MTLVIKDKGLRQLEFDPKRLENKLLTYTKGLKVHPETVDKYIKSVINQISAQEKVAFLFGSVVSLFMLIFVPLWIVFKSF